MKNIKFKTIFKICLAFILIIPCTFVFTACGTSPKDGLSAYEIAVKNGFVGSEQDWLNSLKGDKGNDASQIDTYDLYLSAKEHDGFTGTYLDFIKQNINVVQDNTSIVCNQAVASVVAIDAYNGTKPTSPVSASGIIYKLFSDGSAFIVTNYHVTYYERATGTNAYKNYDIYLYGESQSSKVQATYVGGSKTYDLSVLYVSSNDVLKNSNAKAVSVSTEPTRLGASVLAIGNPASKGLSVSKGIISKDSEYVYMTIGGSRNRYRVLRHDAFITNGSSGGGLFDLSGNLVGITNGGDSSHELINYAIPASIVQSVAENIIANCYENVNNSALMLDIGLTFSVLSTETLFNKSSGYVEITDTITVSDTSSAIHDDLKQLQDALLTNIKIKRSGAELYSKNILRLFDINEFLLLARAGDTIELSCTNDDDTIQVTVTLTDTNFSAIA